MGQHLQLLLVKIEEVTQVTEVTEVIQVTEVTEATEVTEVTEVSDKSSQGPIPSFLWLRRISETIKQNPWGLSGQMYNA